MKTSFHPSSERGALLIVAMLMSAIIAISLTSYLRLSGGAMVISNRALYNNAAMNLAENGLEEAMYSINKAVLDTTYTWTGWDPASDPNDRRRIWTGYTFDQNATGVLRVYVYNYNGMSGTPRAVARSTITLGGRATKTIEKWVEVDLKKTSKFASGLVAKNSVTFNGNNVTVDSFDGDANNDGVGDSKYNSSTYNATTNPGGRKDNGSVGTISVSTGAIATNNGDVWGYVSTAGDDPTNDVGASGSILGVGSPTTPKVDPNRISTDFSASFDPVTNPTHTYYGVTGSTISGSGTTELPIPADVPSKMDADGNYYYTAQQINMTNGTLNITGKVVLKLTDSWAVKMAGNDQIKIGAGATLDLYTDGKITIAGNGVLNGTDASGNGALSDTEVGSASQFQIWGTSTTTQTIDISGNGVFAGTVYAPVAAVTITGSGGINGSVVANNITLAGNANFHYDESLADDGTGNPYRVSLWKELTTATDRSAVDTLLSF